MSSQAAGSDLDAGEAMLEAEVRTRRAAFAWTGVLVLLSAPVDLLVANSHPWASLGLRLGMVGLCAVAASQLERLNARMAREVAAVVCFTVSTLFCLLTAVSGGIHSLSYNWTIVLPIAGVVLAGDSLWYAIGFSLVNAAVAAALVQDSHGAASVVVRDVLDRLLSGGVAVLVALFQRRVHRRQVALAEALRQAKARAAQVQRLAFVGQLASGVAHEINNPLSFVLSNLEFAREELGVDIDLDVLTALDDAMLGIRRVNGIVTDLRTLSRQEEGDRDGGVCELPAVIEEAVRFVGARLDGIKVETALSPVPSVRMPRHRMVQVVVNLLLNAVEALAEGKRTDGAIAIRAEVEEGGVALDVVDNGPGFLPEQLERLFTPFYSAKSRAGTGLGLALCHAYMERFGGTISAENGPSGGAHFHLRLVPEG